MTIYQWVTLWYSFISLLFAYLITKEYLILKKGKASKWNRVLIFLTMTLIWKVWILNVIHRKK